MTQDLKNRAFEVLKGNVCQGKNKEGKEYFYIRPALDKYPYQWLWDSCFHAIVMAHFNINLAKRELQTLLSCVQPDGFLPHLIFWKELNWSKRIVSKWLYGSVRSNNLIQTPVIGLALEKVYQRDRDKHFLIKNLPKAAKFYQWIWQNRVLDNSALPYLIHPFEMGTDGSPQLDFIFGLKKIKIHSLFTFQFKKKFIEILLAVKKNRGEIKKIAKDDSGYLLKSCLFNTVYAQGLHCMARLWGNVGEEEQAGQFKSWADKVEQAILKYHYSPKLGLFLDLFGTRNDVLRPSLSSELKDKQIPVVTISSLMPLLSKSLPSEISKRLVEGHLLNSQEFWTDYPVPTVPRDSPYFEPNFYWPMSRGPVMVNLNWFLYNGLLQHGYKEIAGELLFKTKKMVEKSGFREYYNPLTGEGIGALNYGWSTLVVDMMEGFKVVR